MKNIAKSAVIKEFTRRGMTMERSGESIVLSGDLGTVEIEESNGMLIISFS